MKNVAICPHCEKDLTKGSIERSLEDRGDNKSFVNIITAGSLGIFGFSFVTCPFCNKILGVFNSSPIPVYKAPPKYI